MQFLHEYYKTQERCDKAVDTCPFVCNPVSTNIWFKKCVIVFFKDRLMLKQWERSRNIRFSYWCFYNNIKIVTDWFVTNIMLEKRDNSAFSNVFHDVV